MFDSRKNNLTDEKPNTPPKKPEHYSLLSMDDTPNSSPRPTSLSPLTDKRAAEIKIGWLFKCIEENKSLTEEQYNVFHGFLLDHKLGDFSPRQFNEIVAPIYRDYQKSRVIEEFFVHLSHYLTFLEKPSILEEIKQSSDAEKATILEKIKQSSDAFANDKVVINVDSLKDSDSMTAEEQICFYKQTSIADSVKIVIEGKNPFYYENDAIEVLRILGELNQEIQNIRSYEDLTKFLAEKHEFYRDKTSDKLEKIRGNDHHDGMIVPIAEKAQKNAHDLLRDLNNIMTPIKQQSTQDFDLSQRKSESRETLFSLQTQQKLKELENQRRLFNSHIINGSEKSALLSVLLTKESSLKNNRLMAILLNQGAPLQGIKDGAKVTTERLRDLANKEKELLCSHGTTEKIQEIHRTLLHVATYVNNEMEKTAENSSERKVLSDKLNTINAQLNDLSKGKDIDSIWNDIKNNEIISKRRWIFPSKTQQKIANIHIPARKIKIDISRGHFSGSSGYTAAAICVALRKENGKREEAIAECQYKTIALLDAVKADIQAKLNSFWIFVFDKNTLEARLEAINSAQQKLRSLNSLTENNDPNHRHKSGDVFLSTTDFLEPPPETVESILGELEDQECVKTQRICSLFRQKTEAQKSIAAVKTMACAPAA